MSNNPDNQTNRPNNYSLVPIESSSQVNDGPSTDTQPSNSNQPANSIERSSRQPQTLQDLLRLSTRLQSNEDHPQEQLTEERAEFLKNALNAMTVDLVPELQKRLDILKAVQTNLDQTDHNQLVIADVMDQIVEFLYEIDLAQIFYQIGGLEVIAPFLLHKLAPVRSAAANVILECCKNNPFCQERSVSDEVFGPLMEMASSDPNKDTMFKAIAAVSAITRSNAAGISQFNKYNGVQMVEKTLNCGCEKIVNKTIFLIMGLCDTDDTLKQKLTESDIIPNLLTLLRLSDNIVKEYVLRGLLSITRENPAAQRICQQNGLDSYLRTLMHTNTESEQQDLVECAEELRKQLESKTSGS